MRVLTACCVILLLGACGDDDEGPGQDAGVIDQGPGIDGVADAPGALEGAVGEAAAGDAAEGDAGATVVNASHPGWKSPSCSGAACHTLPPPGHTQTRPPQCAACHGANGACDPNNAGSSKKDHTSALNCIGCHQNQHGYTANADCVACHFAALGVVQDCN